MIGSMRHEVTVLEFGETDQGGGVITPTTTAVDTVRGLVEPLSSGEYMYAQQAGSSISHRVTVRDPIYKSTGTEFTPTSENCELTFEGRTLTVRGVRRREERARSFWIFDCEEDAD